MVGKLGDKWRYPVIDVRATTSPSVTGTRRASPVGTCIHHTDGVNSLAWLQGNSAKAGTPASADVLIRKDGLRYILTGPKQYAYHAGITSNTAKQLFAADNINEALIGIELEYKSLEGPRWEQVDSCAEQLVILALQWDWRWPLVLVGHYGIASPVGRRSDPYGLDWGSLMGRVYYYAKLANLAGL